MKFSELKKNKIKDLRIMLRKKKSELGEVQYAVRTGKQVKKIHKIKELKKEIAQINTAVNYRKARLKEGKHK